MAWNYIAVACQMRAMSFALDGNRAPVKYDRNMHWVLQVLCHAANEKTGVCWPGRKRIARESFVSLSSVDRALTRLEDIGFVSIRPPNEQRSSNTYRVHLARVQDAVSGYQASLDRPTAMDEADDGEQQVSSGEGSFSLEDPDE